jgi:DNA (cytosine-5)-methyltransferase 1
MKLISFHKLGENKNAPRFWIESQRLRALGFEIGTPLSIIKTRRRIVLSPGSSSTNHVSFRRAAGGKRPIIDLQNRSLFSGLSLFSEVKVLGSTGRMEITPSARGFFFARTKALSLPFTTLELFCGGGTLSAAVKDCGKFQLVAGVEIAPRFADVWQAAHPEATLFQSDLRLIHPSELPGHDVLIAAIPCTSHSTLGRAKKSLAGKPELGDTGDLFLSVAHVVAHHMPAACIFENVPAFQNSLACLTLVEHLKRLGYSVFQSVVDPAKNWNEPQNRRRWIAVATLSPGFQFNAPDIPFSGSIERFLDPPSERDIADAERIAGSIQSLTRHRERHSKLGHGFGFTAINRQSNRVPTIVRSYHKINTGPFVETAAGLRLLRKHEIERLMGCEIDCEHYATAVEILGQGVQTRVFASILEQLSGFLQSEPRGTGGG